MRTSSWLEGKVLQEQRSVGEHEPMHANILQPLGREAVEELAGQVCSWAVIIPCRVGIGIATLA